MFPMSWLENGGWKEVGDDWRWCSLISGDGAWVRERREMGRERARERSGLERKKQRIVWRGK